jgi:hypothetical protein
MSNRAVLDYVKESSEKGNAYYQLRRTINRGTEKMLERLQLAGEMEFHTPENKITLAIEFSESVCKPREARYWLQRSEEHAAYLDREIDDGRLIVRQNAYEDIMVSFENEELGFEDPSDEQIDLWRQIYRNQMERNRLRS